MCNIKKTIYCDIKYGITKIYIVAKYVKEKAVIRLHHIVYSNEYIIIMKYLLQEKFITDDFYKQRIDDKPLNPLSTIPWNSYHDPKQISLHFDIL